MEIKCYQKFLRKLSGAGSLYTVRKSTVSHTSGLWKLPAILSDAEW